MGTACHSPLVTASQTLEVFWTRHGRAEGARLLAACGKLLLPPAHRRRRSLPMPPTWPSLHGPWVTEAMGTDVLSVIYCSLSGMSQAGSLGSYVYYFAAHSVANL